MSLLGHIAAAVVFLGLAIAFSGVTWKAAREQAAPGMTAVVLFWALACFAGATAAFVTTFTT